MRIKQILSDRINLWMKNYWPLYFQAQLVLFEKWCAEIERIDQCRILEVGCAWGYHSNAIDSIGSYIGLDISRKSIREAKNRNPKMDYICADIQRIPLKGVSVDIVIAFEILEHVENDLKAVSEVHRILKRSGTLFLSVPTKYLPYDIVDTLRYPGHKHYNSKSLTKLLESRGLRIAHIHITGPYIKIIYEFLTGMTIYLFSLLYFRWLPHFLLRFFKNLESLAEKEYLKSFDFGSNIFIIANKHRVDLI